VSKGSTLVLEGDTRDEGERLVRGRGFYPVRALCDLEDCVVERVVLQQFLMALTWREGRALGGNPVGTLFKRRRDHLTLVRRSGRVGVRATRG